jgi:hypothetical protein
MESRGAGRIGNYRHAASVPLDEDEFVPYRGYVWLRAGRLSWIMGELFLTTKRLIWLRSTIFGLPLGVKLVELPLSDIEGWSIEAAQWWWLSRRSRTVRIRTASRTYDFVTVWYREDADEWAEALENVMVGAGIVPAEASE